MNRTVSERALILAPLGRDAAVAATMLAEAGIMADACAALPTLVDELCKGAGFVIVTEEALRTADLKSLSAWIEAQPEWGDLPFILLTSHGGGLERNPTAARYLDVLGNVTFLERPFHPTTLVSIARSALRGRRRQYEARARLEALHESERQFRTLADSIPTLCWIGKPDGHIFWYNQQWYDYTGTTPPEMEGWGWQSVHDPNVLPAVTEKWQASLATGEPFEMVFPMRAASGEFRPFLTRVQPVRDAHGAIVRWFGTNTDISSQQRAEEVLREQATELEQRVEDRTREREAALAQLHEAQKLETIGQLTGGVAHDFNNLLTPIMGSLDLLRRRIGDDERSRRLIDGALQASGRAATLVQRLLAFARRQDLQTRSVNVAALLDGVRDLITRSIGPTIEVTIRTEADLPPAKIDPNQLELAVLNLAVNARDAMPGGGKLTIVADSVDVTSAARVQRGRYVRIAVVDTGVGMDQATLARAVEPFYSTKGLGKGTGLGLSMVHGLAAQSGGALDLTSKPGVGTRAEMWLPVADTIAEVEAEPTREAVTAARPATILLVDDEEIVRLGTADLLRDLGYRVFQASSGSEALRFLREESVDLVVTDYLMPGMSGVDLAREAAELAPNLPILLITGYSTIADGPGMELPRLSKPFRQTDLAQRVADLLSPTRSAKVVQLAKRSRSNSGY